MFFLHVCLYTTFVPGTQRIEKIVSYLGRLSGATDSCELPIGYWDPNLGLLEELTVLLTTWPSCQLFTLLVFIVLNKSSNPLSFGTLILFFKKIFHLA